MASNVPSLVTETDGTLLVITADVAEALLTKNATPGAAFIGSAAGLNTLTETIAVEANKELLKRRLFRANYNPPLKDVS